MEDLDKRLLLEKRYDSKHSLEHVMTVRNNLPLDRFYQKREDVLDRYQQMYPL